MFVHSNKARSMHREQRKGNRRNYFAVVGHCKDSVASLNNPGTTLVKLSQHIKQLIIVIRHILIPFVSGPLPRLTNSRLLQAYYTMPVTIVGPVIFRFKKSNFPFQKK